MTIDMKLPHDSIKQSQKEKEAKEKAERNEVSGKVKILNRL